MADEESPGNPITAVIAWALQLAALLMKNTVGALVEGFRRALTGGDEPPDEE